MFYTDYDEEPGRRPEIPDRAASFSIIDWRSISLFLISKSVSICTMAPSLRSRYLWASERRSASMLQIFMSIWTKKGIHVAVDTMNWRIRHELIRHVSIPLFGRFRIWSILVLGQFVLKTVAIYIIILWEIETVRDRDVIMCYGSVSWIKPRHSYGSPMAYISNTCQPCYTGKIHKGNHQN